MSLVEHPESRSEARASEAAGTAFDPLSEALQTLRLTSALFFLWEVCAPFATPAPAGTQLAAVLLPGAQHIVSYHVIVEGECWGGLLGRRPVRLRAGDVLFIPRGHAYAMADTEVACRKAVLRLEPALDWFRAMAAGEMSFVVQGGGGDPCARIACGFLGCDLVPFNPVVSALPGAVRLRPRAGPEPDRLQDLVRYAVDEARAARPGSRSVLVRLGELMFMEVVRRCLDELTALPPGWLAGLRDPVVGRCLSRMHRRPAEPWTLASLARAVGSSRSGLAERFAARVGEPPLHYLMRWRLVLAADLLRDDTLSLAAVAARVGYGSAPALRRAFQRELGLSPAQWRRRGR